MNQEAALMLKNPDPVDAPSGLLERTLGVLELLATNARGMQLFELEAPDAVVLDYEMPRANGGLLAGKIRHANSAVPIVMLSGCASVPSSALTAVDIFIRKPAAPSFLIDAIESLTRNQQVFA